MSREIKFRAWHKRDHEMIDCNSMADMMHKVVLPSPASVEDAGGLDAYLNGWVVMQYTGLKDKEGREIYEGDILNRLHSDGVGVVAWDQGTCSFDIVNGGSSEHLYDTTGRGDLGRNEWEVFGNIHEHPELLFPTN